MRACSAQQGIVTLVILEGLVLMGSDEEMINKNNNNIHLNEILGHFILKIDKYMNIATLENYIHFLFNGTFYI